MEEQQTCNRRKFGLDRLLVAVATSAACMLYVKEYANIIAYTELSKPPVK